MKNAAFFGQDFLSNTSCSLNAVQINFIMKSIATQFPGSVNFLKNLAALID